MERHPPHSQAEIRELVAQYLDGVLEPDAHRQVETLLDEFPVYGEELSRQQLLKSKMQADTGEDGDLHFTKVSDNAWQGIFQQLQADGDSELIPADPEFISAYFDREISGSDPQLKAFEAQLFRNDEANRLLGGITLISDTVRHYGCRLESACTLDITDAVMDAYLAGDNAVATEEKADPRIELLSAYVDHELSGKDVIEANSLIENDTTAKITVAQFTTISDRIKAITEELQKQAPDLWPAVKAAYEAEPAKILPFPTDTARKVTPLRKTLQLAIPAAVAAVLLIVAMPVITGSGTISLPGSQSKQSAEALSTRAGGGGGNAADLEIASATGAGADAFKNASYNAKDLDAPMLDDSRSNLATPLEADMPAPAAPPALQEQSQVSDMQPMLEPEAVANKPEGKEKRRDAGRFEGSRGPSSEEYLFNTLSQQMTDEEIVTMLGN